MDKDKIKQIILNLLQEDKDIETLRAVVRLLSDSPNFELSEPTFEYLPASLSTLTPEDKNSIQALLDQALEDIKAGETLSSQEAHQQLDAWMEDRSK